jgi:hypothetical protein
MNTGIGDAVNLAWKLAAVLHGGGSDALLDTYELERLPFARKLVATTDRAFTFIARMGGGPISCARRSPRWSCPRALRFGSVREFMFRTVSQITVNYRDRPLSAGRAGEVHGGDRLPWVDGADGDNHQSLSALCWQVHVYGVARGSLGEWCSTHDVPLHVFAWRPAHAKAGLARDALYLMRPDTYVALAEPTGDPAALQQYFAERQLRPTR